MVEKGSKQGTAEQKLNMQDVLSMRARGYYSQRTAGAKNAIDSVLPLMKDAVSNLPETEISLNATEEDPVALIKLYRGGEETDTVVGHRFSTLRKI